MFITQKPITITFLNAKCFISMQCFFQTDTFKTHFAHFDVQTIPKEIIGKHLHPRSTTEFCSPLLSSLFTEAPPNIFE